MAISTPTNVAAVTGGNTGNLSTYDTAVTVLTSGRLYLLTFANYKSATPAIPTTVTHDPLGTPLSFTLVTDGTTNASVVSYDSAAHRSVSVWRVIPSSTTASALIRVTGMGACSAAGWSLTEVSSGFDSTTPFPQVKVNSGQQTSAIAVTMSSFLDANSLTYLAMAWGDGTANPAETIVATESRTELEEHNDGERESLGDDYQNPNGSDTSIGATLSASTVDWAAIGIELAATASGNAITSTETGTLTDALPAITAPTVATESSTASEARSLTAATTATETASLAESAVASLTAPAVGTDSGTVSESASLTALTVGTDSGTVSETASLTTATTTSETASLAESASLTSAVGTSDTSTLAEAVAGSLLLSSTDQVTITDTPSLNAQVVSADSGTATDTEVATQSGGGALVATDTDTATLADSASPTAAVGTVDSSAFGDLHAGDILLVTTETITESESAATTRDNPVVATEALALGETPLLTAAVEALETGTVAETESAISAGGGAITDTDDALLVEQAIAELLAGPTPVFHNVQLSGGHSYLIKNDDELVTVSAAAWATWYD